MKVLAVISCVLFGLPSVAECNDQEAPVDLQRLLTYPFTGPVAWGVHDTDIEERITARFGKPNKRIPSISEEAARQNRQSNEVNLAKHVYETVLDYDDVTFYLRGRTHKKIIMGIVVKTQSAPIVMGIKLGQHISTLPIENPPEGVFIGKVHRENSKYYRKYSINSTIHGAVVLDDGQQMPAIADCSLTISFDEDGFISALSWYYGTGH